MYVVHGRTSAIDPSMLPRIRGLEPTAVAKPTPISGMTQRSLATSAASPDAPARVRWPIGGSEPRMFRFAGMSSGTPKLGNPRM